MSEDYASVIAALPRLTPEERSKIAERLKMLAAIAPAAPLYAAEVDRAPKPADEVLDAVAAVVLRASGEKVSPVALRRTQQFRSLNSKLPELMAFLSRAAADRVQRRRLLEIGFDLLYKSMREQGHPISARTLMMHAHRLPGAIDAAFPGYAISGALGMVIGGTKRPASGGSIVRPQRDHG